MYIEAVVQQLTTTPAPNHLPCRLLQPRRCLNHRHPRQLLPLRRTQMRPCLAAAPS